MLLAVDFWGYFQHPNEALVSLLGENELCFTVFAVGMVIAVVTNHCALSYSSWSMARMVAPGLGPFAEGSLSIPS